MGKFSGLDNINKPAFDAAKKLVEEALEKTEGDIASAIALLLAGNNTFTGTNTFDTIKVNAIEDTLGVGANFATYNDETEYFDMANIGNVTSGGLGHFASLETDEGISTGSIICSDIDLGDYGTIILGRNNDEDVVLKCDIISEQKEGSDAELAYYTTDDGKWHMGADVVGLGTQMYQHKIYVSDSVNGYPTQIGTILTNKAEDIFNNSGNMGQLDSSKVGVFIDNQDLFIASVASGIVRVVGDLPNSLIKVSVIDISNSTITTSQYGYAKDTVTAL